MSAAVAPKPLLPAPAPAYDLASINIKSAMSIGNIVDNVEPPAVAVKQSIEKEEEPQTITRKDSAVDVETPSIAARNETPVCASEADESSDSLAMDEDATTGKEHREFICMNDEYSECRTGQYTLKLSRKVISNHFGRNKACTRLIKDWPLFCRKHYQRATYKPELWQKRKVNLILRQFDIIEQTIPGTTYEVSLKKSEMDRVNKFARALDAGKSPQDAGELVAPDEDVKAFQAPIDVLRELQAYLGKGQTMDEVKEVLAVINSMIDGGECKEVPSIEFLPEIPSSKAAKGKPAKPVGRVNKRGGVQKPGKK